MSVFLQPVELAGQQVRLEPLTPEHVPALAEAVEDGRLNRLWYTSVPEPHAVAAYVDEALAQQHAGTARAFAVRDLVSGAIVGSTRYCHAEAEVPRLEIGYTWYAARVQRTGVNTESKYLLLRYAFEDLKCVAVEFRTHWLNLTSRAAIARLGAKQDGVLRSHRRLPDGSLRDTVVFSMLESEWPAVKQHLQFRLERGAPA